MVGVVGVFGIETWRAAVASVRGNQCPPLSYVAVDLVPVHLETTVVDHLRAQTQMYAPIGVLDHLPVDHRAHNALCFSCVNVYIDHNHYPHIIPAAAVLRFSEPWGCRGLQSAARIR